MKIRLLRVVWTLSLAWLALLTYGGTFGTAQGELVLNLIVFGWPAFLGVLICYLVTGSLSWPEDETALGKAVLTNLELRNEENDISLLKNSGSDPQDEFLKNLNRSKELVAKQLEISRQKLEADWNREHSQDEVKFEKAVNLIRSSNVIDCCLKLVKETYHWNSWQKNQSWDYPEWIADRIAAIEVERGSTTDLKIYNSLVGGVYTEPKTSLETAFGFKDGDEKIEQYLYSVGDFEGTRFGRLLVKFNGHLVLDASVSSDYDDEYDEWERAGQIHIAKPGSWISSIVNLQEEFTGQMNLQNTRQKLDAKKFALNQNK